jgi:hypothetical protein
VAVQEVDELDDPREWAEVLTNARRICHRQLIGVIVRKPTLTRFSICLGSFVMQNGCPFCDIGAGSSSQFCQELFFGDENSDRKLGLDG